MHSSPANGADEPLKFREPQLLPNEKAYIRVAQCLGVDAVCLRDLAVVSSSGNQSRQYSVSRRMRSRTASFSGN